MNTDFIGTELSPVVHAVTNGMQPANTYSNGDPRLDVRGYESAVREMEDVLSSRLPSFRRSAYRLLGNAADAEDAVQDALLAAYKHLDQFRGQSHMSTWLTTIVRNCARMQLRKRPRQIHLSLDEGTGEEQEYCLSQTLADRQPNPEDECRRAELDAHVRKLATRLSPSLRRTFQLRDMDDLSICETARVLEIPTGTVKAQLARARKKLKESMRRALNPRTRKAYTRPDSRNRDQEAF